MKPTLLLLTSDSCPACKHIRDNPFPKPKDSPLSIFGTHAYTFDFIHSILSAGVMDGEQRWKFINAHYIVFEDKFESIGEINIFELKEFVYGRYSIIHTMYTVKIINESSEKRLVTLRSVYEHVKNCDKPLQVEKPELLSFNTKGVSGNIPWDYIWNLTIPSATAIRRYFLIKPTFLFYDDDSREGNPDTFFAITPFYKTSTTLPFRAIRSASEFHNIDIVNMLREIDKNLEVLVPKIPKLKIKPLHKNFCNYVE